MNSRDVSIPGDPNPQLRESEREKGPIIGSCEQDVVSFGDVGSSNQKHVYAARGQRTVFFAPPRDSIADRTNLSLRCFAGMIGALPPGAAMHPAFAAPMGFPGPMLTPMMHPRFR